DWYFLFNGLCFINWINISRHEEVLRVELAVMAVHRHVFVHHGIDPAGAIAGEDSAMQKLPKGGVIPELLILLLKVHDRHKLPVAKRKGGSRTLLAEYVAGFSRQAFKTVGEIRQGTIQRAVMRCLGVNFDHGF